MDCPIFIFSLPRSGSTLLQRVLMSHNDVCSVAEPWILLPQLYALKEEGTLSEYSSLTGFKGISDFIENLPNKEKDYQEALRSFIVALYSKQCKNNERYFLDKTPRYYLIIDEIVTLFPNAKFIFLFRNPIHVYASIVKTWGNNRFNKLFSNYYDIENGFEMIGDGYLKHKDKSISINYESFVGQPKLELEKISKYLDIDLTHKALNDFKNQNTNGKLGDPTGVIDYKAISTDGLVKWKGSFNSIIRKKYAFMMINKIPSKAFDNQGYNKDEILKEVKGLDNKKNSMLIIDLFDFVFSYIVRKMKINLLINKKFNWINKKFLS